MQIPEDVVFISTSKSWKLRDSILPNTENNEVCFACAVKLSLEGEKIAAVLTSDSYSICYNPKHDKKHSNPRFKE